MLPPSDSINQQSLKLAELVASLRSQNRHAPPPPPTYAVAIAPTASVTDYSFADIGDDDEECAPMTPITIKVDTSIDIEGQGNTIVIPTSIGATSSEEASTSTSSQTSPLQQLQQQRQAKSAQMASTIISALKASGVLDDRETGRQRPVEVMVNSGIRIRGVRNVVCAGVPKKPDVNQAGNGDSSAEERESSSSGGRKRRASSQPAELPSAKKTRL
ncbi:hypothetical protein AJ79_06031 [Helicocarpus griseus UAMH5409]|uniref:Uncharacterized protein n=1 Tax=Helicocarpus griseus UAMH5409 TaxID=1447875 RepID=A0A2B7XH42_9EURO|nr:hypothetical protein AJ79_06031 [Helicocarpus griseus UAMH5409]